MADKFIIFVCLIAITTAASVVHNHPHVPVVQPTLSNNRPHSPDLKTSIEISRSDSSNQIKLKSEHVHSQDRTISIPETNISNMSTKASETLLRSTKNSYLKNKRHPGPALRRFRRPRSSGKEEMSFLRPAPSNELSRAPSSFEVQRMRRDIKEITSVPPGELLTRKSLQNIASFIAGVVGVFFGPFGAVLSAVITPYISDIVYALAGFVN